MRGLISLLFPADDRGTVLSDEQSAALYKRLSDDLHADFTSILSKSADAVSAILKDAKAAKTSQDQDFHWCTKGGKNDTPTVCLYVPPRGM